MKKKYEVLYDWSFAEITRLADSEIANDFADNLQEPDLTSFVEVTEKLRHIGAELVSAKADRQHFPHWGDLRRLLQRFEVEFSTFPNSAFKKFILFTIFAEKLDPTSGPIDSIDIDETAFVIHELSRLIPLAWFSKENSLSFFDSIAIFSCSNIVEVETSVAAANLSPNLVFHLLAAICETSPFPNTQVGLVKRTPLPLNIASVEAYLRIKVLASGLSVHSPKKYTSPVSVLNPNSIVVGPHFQQWGDAINVLSEYNSRDEILIKYLTIYHVIENFMFKRPIVELEQKNNGQMFSIREFRKLYRQVDLDEKKALKLLFTDIFPMAVSPGVSVLQHIHAEWTVLNTTVNPADIDNALFLLETGFNSAGFRATTSSDKFATLVYLVRNAIVHNKETEFHLTYASMTPAIESIIATFLIPRLEEISFAVIGQQTSNLWYQNKEISLYQ